MRRFLLALALLFSSPVAAQTISGCSTLASNRVTVSTDRVAIQKGIDCYVRVKAAADVAIAMRRARLVALAKSGDIAAPLLGNDVSVIPAAIASNIDTAALLTPAWTSGTAGAIPATARPDVVGAFRFVCSAGQLSYDDPVVFPGQPGRSHMHQYFGNTGANAFSTYASLRTTGDSTCMNALNRSAYWMPAMLSGDRVVRPDFVSIYYKRRPAGDPECFHMAAKGCVALPRGLRFVFGYDMVTGTPPTGGGYFNCDGAGATSGHYATLTEAATFCPDGSRTGAIISAPSCWDGRRLDSPNHRDHVAYVSYGNWGYEKCPDTHPYVIPTFTMGAWYTSLNVKGWSLSSDDIVGMKMAPGSTFHADWFGAWDDATMAIWTANCIDKLLTCVAGDLGNGMQLRQVSAQPGKADPATMPIPIRPTN